MYSWHLFCCQVHLISWNLVKHSLTRHRSKYDLMMHVRQNQTMTNWALNLPTSLSSKSLAACKKTTDNLLLWCIWQMPAPLKKMKRRAVSCIFIWMLCRDLWWIFFCTVYKRTSQCDGFWPFVRKDSGIDNIEALSISVQSLSGLFRRWWGKPFLSENS